MKTADEVIQSLPWRWGTHGLIFLVGGLAYMFDAWDVLLTGFVMPMIKSVWGLSTLQVGLFGTATYVGMGLGAFLWGAAADIIGRKRILTASILFYSIFSLTCALAPTYNWLLVLRFIAGLALGGTIPVVYSYVAEFMPSASRGKALNLLDAFWGIGATLNAFTATYLSQYHNWRLLFLVMIIPGILVVLASFVLPESPSFLVRKNRFDEANLVIKKLVERTRAGIKEWTMPEAVKTEKFSFANIFTQFVKVWKFNWKLTLGLWIVVIVIFLHRFGVTIWLPSILIKEGYAQDKAFLTAGIMSLMGFIGILTSSWLVEFMGRKKFLMTSALLAAIIMVIFTKVIGVTGLSRIVIMAYGLVAEPVIATLYTFISESYPTAMRATGFGCASLISRFTIAFLVSLVFGSVLWPAVGTSNSFIIMGCAVAVGMFVLSFLPETRGKVID